MASQQSSNIVRNTDRIVRLRRSDTSVLSSEDTTGDGWRSFIYDTLKNERYQDTRESDIIRINSSTGLSTFKKALIVDSRLDLLMENQVSHGIKNNLSPYFKDDLSKVNAAMQKSLAVTSNIPGPLGAAMGLMSGMDLVKGYETIKSMNDYYQALKVATSEDDSSVAVSSLPWVENVEAWTGSSGSETTLSYTFKFAMGQYGLWNALEEVFKPIINILAIAAPRTLTSWGMAGPFPSKAQLETESGVNIIEKIFSGKKDTLKKISESILSVYRRYTWDIKFGRIVEFRNCIIRNCDYSFASDTDDQGFPITGTVTIYFSTVTPLALASTMKNGQAVRFGGGFNSVPEAGTSTPSWWDNWDSNRLNNWA